MPVYATHSVLPRLKKDADKFFPDLIEPANPGGYVHFLYEPDITLDTVSNGNGFQRENIECGNCRCSVSSGVETMDKSWKCPVCLEVNYFSTHTSVKDVSQCPSEYVVQMPLKKDLKGYRLLLVLDGCIKDDFEMIQYHSYLESIMHYLTKSQSSSIQLEIACFWILPNSEYAVLSNSGIHSYEKSTTIQWLSVNDFSQFIPLIHNYAQIQTCKRGKRLKRNIPFEEFPKMCRSSGGNDGNHYIYKCNILLFGGCTTKTGKIVGGALSETLRDFRNYNTKNFRKVCDEYSQSINNNSTSNVSIKYQFFICSLHDCGIWEMFTNSGDKCELVMFLDEFSGDHYNLLFQQWWDSFYLSHTSMNIFSSDGHFFKNCGTYSIKLNKKANAVVDQLTTSDLPMGFKGSQFTLNNSHVKNYCSTFHIDSFRDTQQSGKPRMGLNQYPDYVTVQYEMCFVVGISAYKKVSTLRIPLVTHVEDSLEINTKVLAMVIGKQNLYNIWRFTGTNLSNIEWKIKECNAKINSIWNLHFKNFANHGKQILFNHEEFLQLMYMMKFSIKLLDITNVSPDEYIKESFIKWGGAETLDNLILDLCPLLDIPTTANQQEALRRVDFNLNHPLMTQTTDHLNVVIEVCDFIYARGDAQFLENQELAQYATRGKPFRKILPNSSNDRLVIHKLYPSVFIPKQSVLFDFTVFKQRI